MSRLRFFRRGSVQRDTEKHYVNHESDDGARAKGADTLGHVERRIPAGHRERRQYYTGYRSAGDESGREEHARPRIGLRAHAISRGSRCSTSQRTTPPMNIVADVEIGRYTPTATGSEGMPRISIAIARNAPMRMSPHGSFCVRMPSTTSAMICAFGESSFSTVRPAHVLRIASRDAGIDEIVDRVLRVDEILARGRAAPCARRGARPDTCAHPFDASRVAPAIDRGDATPG